MLSNSNTSSRRKFLKLAGAAGLTGLAGCSGGGDGGATPTEGGGGDGGGGQTTKTTTQATTTLRVGYLSWLSGPLSSAGIQHRQGMEIGLEATGSVGDIEMEWIPKDTQGSPETAIKRARELVQQEDADLITGLTTSASGKALQEFSASQGVPFVHAGTQTPDVTKEACKETAFRYCTNIIHQEVPLAEALARMTPDDATRVTGINPDYVYGHQSWEIFKREFKKRRPDVEFVSPQFPAFMKGEYKKEIQALLDTDADIVHSVLFSGDMLSFIKQAKQFNLFEQIPYFGSGALDLVANSLGDQMVEAIAYNPTNWAWKDNPRMKEFTKRYVEKHNTVPDGFFAGYGRSNVDCIAAAVEKAGTTEQGALIDALAGLTFESVIPTTTIREGDHQGFHENYLVGHYGPMDDDPIADKTIYGMKSIEMVSDDVVRKVDPDECKSF